MAVGTTGALAKTDIEVLIGDKELWQELRTKLAKSRVLTSMGVQEMTRQFLVENRSSLDERKTELGGHNSPESRRKSSAPHQSIADTHRSLTNVFSNKAPKRSQKTRVSRALSLNDLPLRKGISMATVLEDDSSLADDNSTSSKSKKISNHLADFLPPRPPKKHIPKAKVNLLKALDTASTLSYELRNSRGFAKAFENLSENAESCGDSVMATHGSDLDEDLHFNKTSNMVPNDDNDDASENGEPLLVSFPAKPRSTTTCLSVDRPPVAPTA